MREVTHVAMTVGASRMKVLADAELERIGPLGSAAGLAAAPAGTAEAGGQSFAAAPLEGSSDGG